LHKSYGVSSPIQFFSEEILFKLKRKSDHRYWLLSVIREEKQKAFYINYIFCRDDYLLELNKTYLAHSTLTDILTFSYDENAGTVSGDIFISIERVQENSVKFKQDFDTELRRVMVHGVLHLTGHSDKGKKEKNNMRELEDRYLAIFKNR